MPGVVHGMRSYLMQDEYGQVEEAMSISAGLDYPGVGPEHSYLASIGRAEYPSVTDAEVIDAFQLLSPHRGHHPRPRVGARHRLAGARAQRRCRARRSSSTSPAAATRTSTQMMDVLGIAGAPEHATMTGRLESELRAKRDAGRKLLVPYITGGYPGWEDAIRAAAANGADAIEIGIPFSDPVMDGPVIQQASQAALDARRDAARRCSTACRRSTSRCRSS